MKPEGIRLQNCYASAGLAENPVVCWRYADADAGHRQQACRIRVMSGDTCVYDSGVVRTDRQNGHLCRCILETHTFYRIYVRAEDENGFREEGKPYCFWSGVREADFRKAKWISGGLGKPHYLRKQFVLPQRAESAILSVAGVGQYCMKINGHRPDDSVLNGSWTDYNKHIHYQTFDITSLLAQENELCIEVGNGWYLADESDDRHFYTRHMGYVPFGDCLSAIAYLSVVLESGQKLVMTTDSTWSWRRSETTCTNIYGSEDYDARLEEAEEWYPCTEPGEGQRPKGKLIPMQYPPVKIIDTYEGIFRGVCGDGGRLYDLGQNMSGLFEVAVRGERGTKLRIMPVEKLDASGNPWKTTESWCCYTLKGGGTERWRPKFTYGAGRYLVISAVSEEKEQALPEILSVSGHFISSAARNTGSFYCSDHRYMQIHDLVKRAVESNLNHVHTDCPTIEKLGWQEVNHLMLPSVFYIKDAATLWEKIAMDQRDSQYTDGETDRDQGKFPHEYGRGLLPSIAPRYARFLADGGEGSFWDIVPWGSSLLLGARQFGRFTGDFGLLEENYDATKRYADYLYQKYVAYPGIYGKPERLHFLCHGLGDWGIEQNRGESRENIETAYFYRDLAILSETAGILGKTEEQNHYKEIAQTVLEEYNRELLVWNPATGEWAYTSIDKTGISPTQACQAIPLQFGMVPEDKKESVQRSFLLACADGKLRTGEIGLPYILRTLGELGQANLVRDMIFQKYHPGYYRFVEMGETTLPEFWRDDARSRNHDMMGSILEWLYRYMAGISSEDGYRHICIRPNLPDGVHSLKCIYDSITGRIEVSVLRDPEVHLEVLIPTNTVGEIWIGGEQTKIEGGKRYRLHAHRGGA